MSVSDDHLHQRESRITSNPSSRLRMTDLHDQVFLDLALPAGPPELISSVADLMTLKEEIAPLQILNAADS